MKKLEVVVCKAGKGISAHLPEVDGYVIARNSFEKLRKDLEKGVQFHIEGLWPEERQPWMDEAYSFEYRFEDIPSLLEGYQGVLNQSILARISGINESLMRQYVLGIKRPGAKVKERILHGLQVYADDLKAVSL